MGALGGLLRDHLLARSSRTYTEADIRTLLATFLLSQPVTSLPLVRPGAKGQKVRPQINHSLEPV